MVKSAVLWFRCLILSAVCQKVYSNETPYLLGLWPAPKVANLEDRTVQIDPKDYSLNLNNAPLKTRHLLKTMTEETLANLLTECGTSDVESVHTHVIFHMFVTSSDLTLTWESSEKYALDLKLSNNTVTMQVKITADTVYGARHALETFTHLTITTTSYYRCTISIVSTAQISDEPVFKHRGLLLDTAKHFFRVNSIKRTLDAMATSKMNVFHWHITDTPSFPLESRRVPEFSRFGAFDASQIYTKKDVGDIVEYARNRGIRVMIELDGPAHVYAGWKWESSDHNNASEKMVLACRLEGQFNVANQKIYNVLKQLYTDITEYLPKPILLHMGGDEVSRECWTMNEKILNYMESNGIMNNDEGFFQLWAEFHNKTLKKWDEAYKADKCEEKQPVMLWSSDLTDPNHIRKYLNPKRYVIELWDRMRDAPDLLHKGYRIVIAPSSAWYLDNSEYTWLDMYYYKFPYDSNVLGGEAAMWTENVDELILDERIWPRAAAVAERLWSDPDASLPRRTTKARLARHRERLVARGLSSEVLSQPL